MNSRTTRSNFESLQFMGKSTGFRMSEECKSVLGAASPVDTFLREMNSVAVLKPVAHLGRLVFAMDATASREPTWNQACRLQAQMFDIAAGLGGLSIQVCYYQGYDRFEALPWHTDADTLRRAMGRIACVSGYTQLARTFRYAADENRCSAVNALVFIGDALEEDTEPLYALAGELGLRGVRIFMFQEGDDPTVNAVFQRIAELSAGAYARFDASSPDRLAQLLRAAAVYASGGIRAMTELARREGPVMRELTQQLHQP